MFRALQCERTLQLKDLQIKGMSREKQNRSHNHSDIPHGEWKLYSLLVSSYAPS